MKFVLIWSRLSLVFGILMYWAEALPLDMEDATNMAQMAALNAAGIIQEKIQNFGGQFNHEHEIDLGPFKSKGSIGTDIGDAKERRRRSTFDDEAVLPPPNPDDHRPKRSPCGRRSQTTATPNNGAGGAAEAGGAGAAGGAAGAGGASGAAGAGGANGAGGAAGGVNPEIPRRRKRSPDENDENDFDENNNIIPNQRKFKEKAEEIGETIHQLMNNMLDAMARMFENLRKSMQRASE